MLDLVESGYYLKLVQLCSGAIMNRSSGKVAVITGAAHGIGRGCAERLAQEGAAIALVDTDGAALEELTTKLLAQGRRTVSIVGDCMLPDIPAKVLTKAEGELGPVDILFNNVGKSMREFASPFLNSDEAAWRSMLEINLLTTMRFSRIFGTGMCERGWGRIVNVGSDSAFAGDLGYADYGAAKMGVLGFTRALAREVAAKGVTVNAVCPGPINTRALLGDEKAFQRAKDMVPAGFIGEVSDIAAMVALLASDEGRFITGQSIIVDGGRWMI